MKIKKAKKVNFHNGSLNGVKSVVIDYTVDGVNWINHGIYQGKFLRPEKLEMIKKCLLAVGAINSRKEQLFN